MGKKISIDAWRLTLAYTRRIYVESEPHETQSWVRVADLFAASAVVMFIINPLKPDMCHYLSVLQSPLLPIPFDNGGGPL